MALYQMDRYFRQLSAYDVLYNCRRVDALLLLAQYEGEFVGVSSEYVQNGFGEMLGSPGTMAFWTILITVLGFAICWFGIRNGVERVTKVMMTAAASYHGCVGGAFFLFRRGRERNSFLSCSGFQEDDGYWNRKCHL